MYGEEGSIVSKSDRKMTAFQIQAEKPHLTNFLDVSLDANRGLAQEHPMAAEQGCMAHTSP